jgi:O-antigen/teichoic acid export membrane protein
MNSTKLPTMGSSLGGMLVLRLASQAATLTAVIILTRALGPDEFGRYAFLFGYLTLFTLFNVNGLNDILVREAAARPSERDSVLRAGLWLKLMAGLWAYFLAVAILTISGETSLPLWVCYLGALTLFVSFSVGSVRTVWDVPYQVDFRMTAASLFNLATKLLFVAALVVWLITGGVGRGTPPWGVIVAVVLQVSAELTGALLQARGNRKYGYPMKPRRDRALVRYLVREVWPLGLAGGLVMIFTQIQVVMIKYFLGERAVGLFAAPKRFVDALSLIPTVFIAGFLPLLARSYKEELQGDKEPLYEAPHTGVGGEEVIGADGSPTGAGGEGEGEFRALEESGKFLKLVRLSYRVMLAVALPVGGIVVFYAKPLMELVSGVAFTESAPVLAVIIWAAPISFSGIIFSSILVAAGAQRYLVLIFGLQVIFGLIVYPIFIAKWGIIGMAWGTLTVYPLMFPAALFFKRINFAGWVWLKALPLPLAAALGTGWVVRRLGVPAAPAVVLIPLLFYAIVFATGWISREDIRMARRIVGMKADINAMSNKQ